MCAMNVNASPASSPKQPMPSPRTVTPYLPDMSPNDKRADSTGPMLLSGVCVEDSGGLAAPSPCAPLWSAVNGLELPSSVRMDS